MARWRAVRRGMGYGVRRGRGRAFGEPEAAEAGARSAPKLVPLTLNGNGHQTGVSSKAGQGSKKRGCPFFMVDWGG